MRYVLAATVLLAAIGVGCEQEKEPVEVAEQDQPKLIPVDRFGPSANQPDYDEELPTLRDVEEDATWTTPTPLEPEPVVHVIRKDDTLWSLAVRYLNDGQRWRDIMDANRDLVSDPRKLPIGGELVIPAK